MRGSKFLDRCFVLVVLIAMMGFMAGVAFALLDHAPRQGRVGLFLQSPK